MPRIDGRNRLLAHGDRPKKKEDLLEIVAASVLHRLPATSQAVALEVAELVLRAFAENGLRIIWKPKPPPSRPTFEPPKRGKGSRSSRLPMPRMGESLNEAEERLKREREDQ
ncbi:MAG: hypothetical protein FJX54_13155 [Alphaproteobacteria bacterium]|nr:hypothetical protein [Alphaproteobacteria bacterium]